MIPDTANKILFSASKYKLFDKYNLNRFQWSPCAEVKDVFISFPPTALNVLYKNTIQLTYVYTNEIPHIFILEYH